MGMSGAVLGLEDVGGPTREIVDKAQILLGGLGYGPIMRREHAPDVSRFADERSGLDSADAGIQHDFQDAGPGEDRAVRDVRNDHALSRLQTGAACRVAWIDGIEKFQERLVKATMHLDMQTPCLGIVDLDIAHVGTSTFDDGIQDFREEGGGELRTKRAAFGQFLDLSMEAHSHFLRIFQGLSSFAPHEAPALDHSPGLLNAMASIVEGAGWKRLGHERPEKAFPT